MSIAVLCHNRPCFGCCPGPCASWGQCLFAVACPLPTGDHVLIGAGATFGCAVLEQEQLLERVPREKAWRERKHEENVKAAEGQHEKVKHAKANNSKPEPEARGEAVATKVVNADGHNPDSTPAPPQSPQVPLLLVLILVCLSTLVAVESKQDLIQRATRECTCLTLGKDICLTNGLVSE